MREFFKTIIIIMLVVYLFFNVLYFGFGVIDMLYTSKCDYKGSIRLSRMVNKLFPIYKFGCYMGAPPNENK